MDTEKDLYSVLSVAPDAGVDIIKKAYRRLVHEFHPDRFQDRSDEERSAANEKMVEITEAYRVLVDPVERSNYDNKRNEHRTAEVMRRTGSFSAAAVRAAAEQARATPPTAEAPAATDQGPQPGAAPTSPPPPASPPPSPRSAGPSRATTVGRESARDFLGRLFAQLQAKANSAVPWKEHPPVPGKWTKVLKSDQFGTTFSLMVYQTRDATPSLARQFLRTAEEYIKQQKSQLRDDYMIFVLAFEKMPSPEEVMTMCRQFERQGKSGLLTKWYAAIMLIDAVNMRSFPGTPLIPKEELKQTFQVLQGRA